VRGAGDWSRSRGKADARTSRFGNAPRQFLASLRSQLTVAPLTAETHALGLDFAECYTLSIYDAMIAAATTLAGCARLWSQDMQDGMKIGNKLRVANPFK
jgi:predicted nucleic acid-binding protein